MQHFLQGFLKVRFFHTVRCGPVWCGVVLSNHTAPNEFAFSKKRTPHRTTLKTKIRTEPRGQALGSLNSNTLL